MAAASDWQQFACAGARNRWRYLADGRIEIDGVGTPELDWPQDVNRWRGLIESSAAKHGVPPAWIAAIMAQETGGRAVCLDAANPSRVCYGACQCVQNEGAGVMAMLPSTATGLAGRKVTSQELMDNTALAIDLGTKFLKSNLDRYNGDYLHAAVSYNAGRVKCGRGSTFVPAGAGWPREPCPDTGWGVVFGCVYANKKYGDRCQASSTGVKPYVCSTDYPRRAIESQNAARHHFEGRIPRASGEPGLFGRIATLAAGAAFGYAALEAWGAR